jgi:drug/metabolite transporter (DMT)-like permease
MLPLFLALISASCYGLSKVLIRKAANVDPFVSTIWTLAVAPPILLCATLYTGDAFVAYHYDLWTIANLAMSGIMWLALGRVFAYTSINLIGAARASQLTSTQVIFAAVLSVIFLQENMTLTLAVGTTAIFLGELLISTSNPQGKRSIPAERFRKGLLMGLVGGFLWGSAQLFAREGTRGLGSPLMSSLITYAFAILAQGVLMIVLRRRQLNLRRAEAGFVIASGTLSTVAVVAQYTALLFAPVVAVSPIVNTSPLITLVASYVFMPEVELINRKVLLGAIGVVFGAALVAAL